VVLVVVVAEALCGGTHHLALQLIRVHPAAKAAIRRQLLVVLFVLLVLPLIHELAAVVAHQVAVFDVGVDMLVVDGHAEPVFHRMFTERKYYKYKQLLKYLPVELRLNIF